MSQFLNNEVVEALRQLKLARDAAVDLGDCARRAEQLASQAIAAAEAALASSGFLIGAPEFVAADRRQLAAQEAYRRACNANTMAHRAHNRCLHEAWSALERQFIEPLRIPSRGRLP